MKEIKSEKKKNEKKKERQKEIVERVLLLVLLLILLCLAIVRCAGVVPQTASVADDQADLIQEIDYSKEQEKLNAMVKEGQMNVNYRTKAVFRGTASTSFQVKNIKNNHYPIVFELLDENDESLYLSQEIKPGYEMNSIHLQKALQKGVHECHLKVGYAKEGTISTVFPITIEVK